MSDWLIPLSDLSYGPEEQAAVERVLRSRWLSMGPEVAAFESSFAERLGLRHALAVANGTAALHLALLSLGIGPGDEVVQPAVNFVAAANMTMAVGAQPVFADLVGLDEPTIDPLDVERRITPRTAAVIVMHYGGYPCRMSDISDVCRRRGIALVEDAAHGLGTRYLDAENRFPHSRAVGALGDVACFSFFSNKNLATGEGGMIVTDRDDVAEAVKKYRSHGMTTLTWERHKGHASSYDVLQPGYNYRFDELRAALGRVQLAKLDGNNARRAAAAARYRRGLHGIEGIRVPFQPAVASAHHLMVITADTERLRDSIRGALAAQRIQTSLHYPCIPEFEAYRASSAEGLVVGPAFSRLAVTLPLYPDLGDDAVDEVCACIRAQAEGSPPDGVESRA